MCALSEGVCAGSISGEPCGEAQTSEGHTEAIPL